MAKTSAQLDREIAQALGRKRPGRPSRQHATVLTAAPHVEAINEAIYRTKDPDALVAAVVAAKKHATAMKRIAGARGGHVDSTGQYDPAMYDLANLLVKANEMVRRIKIARKTGRIPRSSHRTAWKLR